METILKGLAVNNELCGIYTNDGDPHKFSVGYVLDLDDTFFLFERIDPYGTADGLMCVPIDNVFNVEIRTEYLLDVRRLFMYNEQKRYQKIENDDDVVYALLRFAIENEKICAIELNDSGCEDCVGYINEAEDDTVHVALVGEHGEPDGEAFIDIDRISAVCCDSVDQRKIEILNRIKTGER
ncbi:MAG: hypothetical protein LBP62_06820 [Clostridiales bacterium]|jgi:hypothetical protein|nr:hypothetical protein [Clostridiales bacterium]